MKPCIFIYLLFNTLVSFSQDLDTIQWRESHRLTWDDFKGTPVPGRPEGAITNVEFISFARNEGKEYRCLVMFVFNRQASWGLDKYKNAYVLSHEQGHFDLYEIAARKFREILSNKTFPLKTIEKDLQKLVDKLLEEAEKEQSKYDKETGVGINEDDQKRWIKKIAEELQRLSKYKNSDIILSVS